jgi:hypothetical protein
MDLDNDLVNIDGALDAKMKEKKKLLDIQKNSKDEKSRLDADEKIKLIDEEINNFTETKLITEDKYKSLINSYLSRKQKKELTDLKYLDLADSKANPEAEKISTMDSFNPTPEYFAKKTRMEETLQKELNSLGLSDVKVKVKDVADEKPGEVVEGFFGTENGQKVIALSMALYDPQMSDKQLLSNLRSVMSHEIIHVVRNLQIITPKEFNTLVEAATKRNYVFIADGKPIVRKYSYLDRSSQMRPDLKPDKQAEEAVAELFRDYASGKVKLVARPKTIFDKIINAIKAIFNAHAKEGFTKAEQIFDNILSTDTEKQIGARQRTGAKTEGIQKSALILAPTDFVQNPQDIKTQNKETRTDFQKEGLFENMGKEGALTEFSTIGSNLELYIQDNNRQALNLAILDPQYDEYYKVLQQNLQKAFPNGKINLMRIENYVEIQTQTPQPEKIYSYHQVGLEEVAFVGGIEEREIIVVDTPRTNEEGAFYGNNQLLSYFMSKNQEDAIPRKLKTTLTEYDADVQTPYNKNVQDALSQYARGNLSAKEVRKVVKDEGYQLEPSGLRSRSLGQINVYPSNDKMKEGELYSPQVYDYSALKTEDDAGRLLEFIKNNPDGFTIDVDSLEFPAVQSGIAVAPVKKAEIKVDPNNLTVDQVYEFAETVTLMSRLGNVKMFAGGWFDKETNEFNLDSSMVVDDTNDALYLADAGKQKAIFNLGTFEETRTQDGIKKLKETSAYDSNAHDDRRRYVQQLDKKFEEARNRGEIKSKLRDFKESQKRSTGRTSTENRGLIIEPETDENGLVTLTHYSPISGLEEIRPDKQGTNNNIRGQESIRRRYFPKDYPERSYYGLDVDKDYGYKKEEGVGISVGDNIYETKVPLENLYNIDIDDLKLRAKAILNSVGDPDQDLYATTLLEKYIKEEGFIGYFANNSDLGLTAAIFQPLSVKPAKEKNFSALPLPGGAKDIGKYLLPAEQNYVFSTDRFGKKRSDELFKLFTQNLPSSFEMANVAVAGIEKKGWYKKSAQGIVDLFGVHDGRRFAALLAATSPQTPVERNLSNALKVWIAWNNNGRPTDLQRIEEVSRIAIGNEFDLYQNNLLRSLSTPDGQEMGILLSGPKVNSFMMNLIGNVEEITNDTWMVNYAAVDIDPKLLKDRLKRDPTKQEIALGTGQDVIGKIAQKKVSYIALSAKTREAAEVATQITGELWTPAEIQETVWSITKALGDMAKYSPKSASELLISGALTNQDVASVPDFATLMSDGIYREILERGGYGQRLRARDTAETGRVDPREERSVLRLENRKIDPDTFRQELLNFAERLETNITTERINKEYSSLPTQEIFDLVASPQGGRTFGVIPFKGRLLNVLFPKGRHFTSTRDLNDNMTYGDGLGSFGLLHMEGRRPGVQREFVSHLNDLLRLTNYKRPEDALSAIIKKAKEYIVRNPAGKHTIEENKDFTVDENFNNGNITLKLKKGSALNNRKTGKDVQPLKLVLFKGSRMRPDPEDTSGLPPVGSFENPNIPVGANFYYVKTFFNELRDFSAIPVQEVIPESAEKTDQQIEAKQQNIRYNTLAPFLSKPLKIFFPEDKATVIAERIVTRFQDAFQPVGKMLDQLRNQGLNIADALDPYMKEKLFHGRVKDLSIKAYENFYTPMGELIEKINVNQSELDTLEATKGTIAFRIYKEKYPDIRLALADLYLYARHAKERNEFVSEQMGRGLGSSMADSEAQTYLDWFENLENNEVFSQIAVKAREITQDTTNQRINSGLIPSNEMEAMNRFSNYVPLRGDITQEQEINDDLAEEIVPRTKGTYFGAKGRPDPSIKEGRPSGYAEYIIPSLMSQNQKTIELAERNKVGRSLLNLTRGIDTTIEEQGTENSQLRENMKDIARVLDEKELTELRKSSGAKEIALHVINVRENGKDVAIYLNDPRIARAMKIHYSPDNMGTVVRAMSQINRFLSNVNTSWNPSFVIPNFAKDLETAGVNIQQYGEKGITKEVAYNTFKALRGIRDNLRTGEVDTEWAKEYLLFREYGGQNATNQMGDLETQVRNLREVLGNVGENSRLGKLGLVKNAFLSKGKSILSFLDDYNTAVENGVRVATFRALRNRGMTLERAAEAARDITVNFAKGGEDKGFMNAWFLFYNASLQGSMALFNAAVKSKRVQKFWAGLFVYGILQDQLNALASGDEDEDGILDYDELSTYELEHNLILPIDWLTGTGDKMIKIPLGYGLNMAVNTGRALSRAARGEYTAGEATNTILATLTEMVNPLGGTESFLNFVSPTVADPFVSLYINKDYKGDPITKDSPTFASVPTPDSHSHWNTTGEIPKAIAKTLNELGGNELRSGLIDISPDTIQFWFDYVTGGAGRFVLRTGETIAFDVPEILAGDFEGKIVPRIPLARKIIATPSEIADTGTYLENRKELFTIFAELDLARRAGDTERFNDVSSKYKEELKIFGRVKALDNARNRLLRQIKKIEKNPRLEEERKKKLIKNIRKKINEFQKRGLILMRSAGLKEAS